MHRWFNITNIIPHSLEDGSLEPKRYSVDFASQWISATWITLLSIFLDIFSGYTPLFTCVYICVCIQSVCM